jgi:hypothetical protein
MEGADDFFPVFALGILRVPFQPEAILTLGIGHFDIMTPSPFPIFFFHWQHPF